MSIPRPLLRLQAYTQREYFANVIFNGRASSATLQASVPTIQALTSYGGLLEVAFMGRSNTGKSRIINEVFKIRALANVGKDAGVTESLNFYRRIGRQHKPSNELILVDAPGYGDRGRPEWGKLFDHYLRTRDELRRVFIVINAEHGVTRYDKLMLEHLEVASKTRGFTLQAILSKCDRVPRPLLPQVIAHRQKAISECSPSCLPAIATASSKRARFGFNDVRYSILEACGFIEPLPPPM